jgi:hypothetical protein
MPATAVNTHTAQQPPAPIVGTVSAVTVALGGNGTFIPALMDPTQVGQLQAWLQSLGATAGSEWQFLMGMSRQALPLALPNNLTVQQMKAVLVGLAPLLPQGCLSDFAQFDHQARSNWATMTFFYVVTQLLGAYNGNFAQPRQCLAPTNPAAVEPNHRCAIRGIFGRANAKSGWSGVSSSSTSRWTPSRAAGSCAKPQQLRLAVSPRATVLGARVHGPQASATPVPDKESRTKILLQP